jgi:hypothetical protein
MSIFNAPPPQLSSDEFRGRPYRGEDRIPRRPDCLSERKRGEWNAKTIEAPGTAVNADSGQRILRLRR